jgi:hypothetical protein
VPLGVTPPFGCCNEFIKRQKLCECCQKDISKSADAFVAPAGSEGSFKDFGMLKNRDHYINSLFFLLAEPDVSSYSPLNRQNMYECP